MISDSICTTRLQPEAATDEHLFDSWFDPIERAVRDRVRSFIEGLIEGELAAVLARPRYGRRATDGDGIENAAGVAGHRHGSRTRTLTGTFGQTAIAVPRARLVQPDGGTTEWKSRALRAYQRRTLAAEALIAGAYLAGVNTRRVRRALTALFGGAVGKDIVSRTWRKVKGDWDAWNARSLADEPIVRLILDGTVVRVRLDRNATAISLLVVIGVRTDGQKMLLAVRIETSLVGVPELSVLLTDAENGELNPLGINCLRVIPASGPVVWGSRTLQGDDRLASEWKYIPVRRTALFIEESLFRGTQWVVFEPNDEPLWSQVRLNVGAFMHNLFRQDAFQGQTPREAYFVKCDKETTTQNDINLGVVNIVVGFAPLKPAEFVIIKIQQIAGQIQA